MALTKEERGILEEIREDQKEVRCDQIVLKTVLLGVPDTDDNGLVGQVKYNTKSISKVKIILAAIIGSGVLGGGITGLVQLLG